MRFDDKNENKTTQKYLVRRRLERLFKSFNILIHESKCEDKWEAVIKKEKSIMTLRTSKCKERSLIHYKEYGLIPPRNQHRQNDKNENKTTPKYLVCRRLEWLFKSLDILIHE